MITDRVNKIATSVMPATHERPQMVESAPYIPSDMAVSAPMPVNGMPPVMLPEPVQSTPSAQSAPMPSSQPMPQFAPSDEMAYETSEMPITESVAPSAPNINSTIPQEVLELSETSIGSDGVLRGPSYEIRK